MPWDWRIKMAEYTDEQLNEMLEKAKTEARTGLFTQEELEKKIQQESDRRVNTALEKKKPEWEAEYQRKQNMTAEQLAEEKMKTERETLIVKEREINRKSNLTDAKDMLTTAGIPKSQYGKIVDMLVSEDAETTKANVQNFIDTFSAMKTEIETKVKEDISKIPPPNQGQNKPTTKADFDKLGFAEKVAFKQSNPELYKEFMK